MSEQGNKEKVGQARKPYQPPVIETETLVDSPKLTCDLTLGGGGTCDSGQPTNS